MITPNFTIETEEGIISGPCLEGVNELAKQIREQRARDKERDTIFPGEAPQKMAALARLFPSMVGVTGADPWDIDKFLLWCITTGASSGAMHAARFLLNVWNPNTNWRDQMILEEKKDVDPDDSASAKALVRGAKRVRAEIRRQLEEEEASNAEERNRRPLPVAEEKVTAELHNSFSVLHPFNAAAAVATWDARHREAFIRWVQYPFWP